MSSVDVTAELNRYSGHRAEHIGFTHLETNAIVTVFYSPTMIAKEKFIGFDTTHKIC